MSNITEDSPVNPSTHQAYDRHGDTEGHPYTFKGLTIRQHFASLAMQGLLVRYKIDQRFGNGEDYPMVAETAVQQADALIAELNK